MKNTELEHSIKIMAALLKQVPGMLDTARRNPTFPDIERIAVASIADADSLSEALEAYDDYVGLVPDWKFVFASTRGATPGLSMHRTFSDGSVVRGLFATGAVILLDPVTRQDMEAGREAVVPIDYSISLDSQALSYLAPYLRGITSGIPDDFHEIFSFISDDHVFVDAVPYMLENLPNILVEENVDRIKRRLVGYETLRTIDASHFRATGEVRSMASETEQRRSVGDLLARMIRDASDRELMELLRNRHACLYAVLLKMVTIQLRNPQRALVSKLEEFMEFLDKTMQTIYARETIVAAEYFTKGQKLKFFGKIHKSPARRLPELLDALKNMAWDFLHIRHVEGASIIDGAVSQAARSLPRYFFPSLLTCDKDFVEVIDLYPLKSYAYRKESHQLVPFPAMDWVSEVAGGAGRESEFRHRFYSDEAVERRDNMREEVFDNIHEIVHRLEMEFSKIAVIS
ncbi:hypothetical protein [Paraburkholderia aspalathi]|uniref:hypothetical protein n=1 Tax=Paraburkholderia aspalathi TaxID=1324617 RepID=UPI003CAA2522